MKQQKVLCSPCKWLTCTKEACTVTRRPLLIMGPLRMCSLPLSFSPPFLPLSHCLIPYPFPPLLFSARPGPKQAPNYCPMADSRLCCQDLISIQTVVRPGSGPHAYGALPRLPSSRGQAPDAKISNSSSNAVIGTFPTGRTVARSSTRKYCWGGGLHASTYRHNLPAPAD